MQVYFAKEVKTRRSNDRHILRKHATPKNARSKTHRAFLLYEGHDA